MNYSEDQLRELELLAYVPPSSVRGDAVSVATPVPVPVRVEPHVESAERSPPPPRPPPARDVGGAGSSKRADLGRTTVPVQTPQTPQAPRIVVDASASDLQSLGRTVANCSACGLCKQRKQAVLGVGAPKARWLFVGEAPGAEEDEQGEPFVGQSGRLLDAMLRAIGLARGDDVYIANVVKCRPPGNRTPTPEEALACAPYLDRQIELIAPSLIVALGKTAVSRLTGEDGTMASLRGQVHRYKGIPLIATYHPSYFLRTLPEKVKGWEDLMLAKKTFAGLVSAPKADS